MSLLIFETSEDSVWVLTDTLATTVNGTPGYFTSKCTPFPHLRLLIAGTGHVQLVDRWREHVHSRMAVLDIEMLNLHAPQMLREIWEELSDETDLEGGSATVYHLGFLEDSGQHCAFAYRSSSGFASEQIPFGFALKPPPEGEYGPVEGVDGLISLATQIREEQSRRPAADRVFIGGDLVLTTLSRDAVNASVVHRFPDFDSDWEAMNAWR